MKGVRSVEEEVVTGFERIAEAQPQKTALIYLGEKFTYRQLSGLINKFAAALYGLGIRENDRMMLYLPNCPQWLISYFAIQKIGAIPVPTSPIYTPHEITAQLNDCGAETIICQDTNYGYVIDAFPRTTLKNAIVTNLVDLLPAYKRAVGWFFDRIPRGTVKKTSHTYLFRELLKNNAPPAPKMAIEPGKHIAYILYTGGTTGVPKGVPATHSGMVSYIRDYYQVVDGHISEGQDTFLLVNPLFHIMAKGMFMGIALTLGNPTVLMPSPNVDAVLSAIERHRVTMLLGVPALYRMILENERLEKYNLSSLKYCWCGGDVLPVEIFNRFKALTGLNIFQVYGSTEVGHLCLSAMDEEPSAQVLGKPFSSRQTRVVDPETLEEVPSGQVGELLVTSEYLMEYWNNPRETAAAFVQLEGKKWYRMGDYVRMDDRGQVQYIDRRADVIKHKGYRISASEIESVLQDHEAVMAACVVGVPDDKTGERIKAIVVLKDDARGVGAADLLGLCRERLAPYKVPSYIEFRDMLPKSKVGKLLRREIREQERRKQT